MVINILCSLSVGAITDLFPKAKVVTLSAVGVAKPISTLSTEDTRKILATFFQQKKQSVPMMICMYMYYVVI